MSALKKACKVDIEKYHENELVQFQQREIEMREPRDNNGSDRSNDAEGNKDFDSSDCNLFGSLCDWASNNELPENIVQDLLRTLKNVFGTLEPFNISKSDSTNVENSEAENQNERLNNSFDSKLDLILAKIASIEQDVNNMKVKIQMENNVNEVPEPVNISGSVYKDLFPISTIEQLLDLEEKIQNKEFAENLINYLKPFRIYDAFKHVGTDEFYKQFNLKGVRGMKSILKFTLFNKILHEASAVDLVKPRYEATLTMCIAKARNRVRHIIRNNKNKI